MQLTLNSLTALRIIRATRAGKVPADLSACCDLVTPDPSPHKSWTRSALSEALAPFDAAPAMDERHTLDVLVSDKDQRLRTRGVSCTYRKDAYPAGAFVRIAEDIAISGPELAFVELARVMDPAVHLLLGMELCGRFSRSSTDPREGEVAYDVEPVTTVERLRAFAKEASWIRGARRALETIDLIEENAWSPMEALVAALLVLPVWDLGYDLWPITLNPRKELTGELSVLSNATSRVPDIMFSGTHVGLNYDGEDHFRLSAIAKAGMRLGQEPGDAHLENELDSAMRDARAAIVADKRRDRDLMTLGLDVLSVTKEDLEEEGGLDRVVGQVIRAIEAEGARKLPDHHSLLQSKTLSKARQELIVSLMPGPRAKVARERLKAHESSNPTIIYSCEFGPEGERQITLGEV